MAKLIERAESAILGLAVSADERRPMAINLLIGNVRGNGPRINGPRIKVGPETPAI